MAYTIFDPRLVPNHNHYKAKYPKLREYPELDKLSPDWLVFCWWFSCKASPLVVTPMSHIKRAETALIKAGMAAREDVEIQAAMNGQLPDDVKAACTIFASFDVDVHTEAYLIAVDLYNGLKESIKKENFQTKDTNGKVLSFDSEGFINAGSKAAKLLPELVTQMNQTYGVVEVDESMLTLSADSIAETFFNSKRNS